MKNLFTLLSILLISIFSYAQTEGTLSVTVTTSETGGNYAPKNIVAIWIEDDAGNFIKTLMAYAQNRITHLNTWESATTSFGDPFNSVDAITGATKSSHGTRICTWDGTDVDGNLVIDGNYIVNMELTDKNSTGNYSTVQIVKSNILDTQTPTGLPSFSDVIIEWTPDPSSVDDIISEKEVSFFPNPTSGKIFIDEDNLGRVTILTVSGDIIYEGLNKEIDLTNYSAGIYLIKIISGDVIKFGKIFKE